jgi:hypothetical protein
MVPDEDEVGGVSARGVAQEWSAELSDPRQDIYTLEDGQPRRGPTASGDHRSEIEMRDKVATASRRA